MMEGLRGESGNFRNALPTDVDMMSVARQNRLPGLVSPAAKPVFPETLGQSTCKVLLSPQTLALAGVCCF